MTIWKFCLIIGLLSCSQPMPSQTNIVSETSSLLSDSILVGAARLDIYLPLLHEKRVALVVNQTSIVGNTHLVDTLLAAGVRVKKVFAPEHGFRGEADAGELINTEVDKKTNLPLISLYGKNKKPTQEQLSDIDVVVFDIQDVGARFYTYISTMHYVMEACAEFQKTFVVLDRPNPNGFYVDGPVLDLKYRSFVGMHPIPIVHGLTVGELAQMIVGEKWISAPLTLHVIPCMNYTHTHSYSLPVRPSPNLTNDHAIRLYPSLCLFEGTIVSVGRGTPYPFQVLGAPIYKDIFSFSFTPQPSFGSKNPLYNGMICYGKDLRNMTLSRPFSLSELIEFYHACPHKNTFFNDFFTKLAGTEQLRSQIEAGWSEEQIRASWQKELESYKKTRKKYLLYPDFE